eukprot:CAMPEP_0172527082 /NCGR_PEP_ID=MMETSP1067-20121228/1853_1 /TAXON_ID=265564 ORGANISM="Thalassiosira punctigera, Strain Tpunct2005C2" /NCGR_SAMPLE_ID=MMETSP1067 /ASSEMBLY_ACC=CAM_ASM_000444 /LENGTH=214 /DNA_ID=CAMNT_0013310747 /DNA_START=150 /DNA_END=791 /DNA_ORIENTATION=-
MARGLLVWFVLALSSCATTASAFSSVYPSTKPPPWMKARGGCSGSMSRPSTSLKSAVLGAIDNFYKTMPLASAFFTCGIKASLADMVAQKRAAKEIFQADGDDYTENDALILDNIEVTPFEKRRNVAFLLYGGLYQGMAQEVIFNDIFPILFGQGDDLPTVFSKVLCDSMIVTPFICLPVAYIVKSFIFQYSLVEAFARYKDDILKNGLLTKYW